MFYPDQPLRASSMECGRRPALTCQDPIKVASAEESPPFKVMSAFQSRPYLSKACYEGMKAGTLSPTQDSSKVMLTSWGFSQLLPLQFSVLPNPSPEWISNPSLIDQSLLLRKTNPLWKLLKILAPACNKASPRRREAWGGSGHQTNCAGPCKPHKAVRLAFPVFSTLLSARAPGSATPYLWLQWFCPFGPISALWNCTWI